MANIIVIDKSELSEIIETIFKRVLQEQQVATPAKHPEQKEILTIDETSTFLNLAKATIYALTSKGKIPHFKTGKKLYFKRSELIAWIERAAQTDFQTSTKKA